MPPHENCCHHISKTEKSPFWKAMSNSPVSKHFNQLTSIFTYSNASLSPNSSMTTKELQEYWRNEKSQCRQVKLLFEIPSTRIVEHHLSKYVVSEKMNISDIKQISAQIPFAPRGLSTLKKFTQL
uniref:Uncharacterized protein n=1 Tax=Pavo cristatus TaxID=9049 RepID=A0A8C9FCW1_PAVCR